MWGNKLGWYLAGALVLLMVGVIAVAYLVSGKRTPPTEFTRDAAHLEAIQLPIDPASLLPASSGASGGRDSYWRAINDYQEKQTDYERMERSFDLKQAVEMEGVKALLQGADASKVVLFHGKYDLAVGYGTLPIIDALHKVGGLSARIGVEYARQNRYDEARTYLNAAFILGRHLYQQRLTRGQLSAGLGLMAHCATVLGQIEKADGAKVKAEKYERFVSEYQTYYKDHIQPMERVVTSIDPKVLAKHVGDVFAIAQDSQERVWRIEAILKLGMYKYYTNTAGDRRAAIRTVRSLLDDPAPAIAAAARAADGLTQQQYRTLGSK